MSIPVKARPADEVIYRATPEEPMPQSEWHRILIGLLIEALSYFYRAVDRACVSGDMFVYWKKGDPSAVVGPDVFVVPGAEKRLRTVYKSWEEGGRLPEFVIEILSGTTGDDDLNDKLKRYRDDLRVKEYFVFDPGLGKLDPPLQGYRLKGKKYVPIKPVEGRLPSEVTGLHLEADGNELRLWDPATGEWVPTEAERREQGEARADAAEARIRELEAELARLKPAP